MRAIFMRSFLEWRKVFPQNPIKRIRLRHGLALLGFPVKP